MLSARPSLAATPNPSPSLEYGRVLAQSTHLGPPEHHGHLGHSGAHGRFQVETSFGQVSASRAVSCLVEPGPGDTVLLAVDLSGGAWVLSVLSSASAVNLAVDGDARLTVRGGSLTLAPDHDLTLACAGELSATSGEISVHAARGSAVIERLSFMGQALKTQIKRVRSVAVSVDQVFKRFTLRAQESTRMVKEHDEVQAGSHRLLVEDLCALHAKNHSVMAEEHVVINAEQIHMG